MGKLEWIEIRGSPDYLDLPGRTSTLADGRQVVSYPPPDRTVYRKEIQQVYLEALLQHQPQAAQLRILRRYTANFPHLAFDPDGWLWAQWQKWRSRYSKADQKRLQALASGIKRRGSAGTSKTRARAHMVTMARRCLASLKLDQELKLKSLYDQYRDGGDSRHADVRQASENQFLHPLVRAIEQRTRHVTSASELKRRGLSGVLILAVAKAFHVRARDLH
ncbi:MAG: hypothetical protein DMF89_04700 [Acidobacteria bacterium]|nr:MAG: hypothetical protein DMF89_04700 [Acidobacteriota bacterium]